MCRIFFFTVGSIILNFCSLQKSLTRFYFLLNVWHILLLFILIFIFFSILIFSVFYLNLYLNVTRFLIIKGLFGISIIILILADSLIIILIGWDGLGVTSYLLVAYYNNWERINRASITFITNRLGDTILIWSFAYSSLEMRRKTILNNVFLLRLLIIVRFTKRSQFPFNSWLPIAIAAPTPIRALVHSRTLVTAGIILLLKFFQNFNNIVLFKLLFLAGWITIFVSGFISILEKDGKKIIALSTLNQLGFIMINLSFGNKFIVLFHLVSHAFFKSCIFIQIGNFIRNRFSLQDKRFYSYKFITIKHRYVLLISCIFSLFGLIFFRGIISKEVILNNLFFYFSNVSFIFFMVFSIFFTILYSSRLLKIILQKTFYIFYVINKNFLIRISSFGLFFLGFFFSSWFSFNFIYKGWRFFFNENKTIFIFYIFLFISITIFLWINNILFQDSLYKSTKKIITKNFLWINNFILEKNYNLYFKSVKIIKIQSLTFIILLITFYILFFLLI